MSGARAVGPATALETAIGHVVLETPLLLVLALLAATAAACSAGAQHPGVRIDEYLTGRHAAGFCGAVLVADDGRLILRKAYGLANQENGIRLTPETGFDIGSVTKVFTAAAIYKFVALERLQVTDTLGALLHDVPADKRVITVEQLVMHTSGLPDIVDADGRELEYDVAFDYEPVSRAELVRRAMTTRLLADPGRQRRYSNLGYSLLGVVIEVVSEQPYEDFVREQLFVPAGMTRTGYVDAGWSKEQLAVGYREGRPWGTPLDHEWLPDGPSWNLRANGGMLSNVDELLLWVEALQDEELLPAGVQADYLEALGVRPDSRGVRRMGPAGSNGIFNAAYLWYVEDRRVVICMSNVDRFPAEDELVKIASTLRQFSD